MFTSLIDALFGCSHKNYTFPMSTRRGPHSAAGSTYVVCLDCGKELAYDWHTMKVIPEAPQANGRKSTQTVADRAA